MRLPYKEGTLFSIPLRGGGYAVGVVARTSSRGKIVLTYLFGPTRKTVPKADELNNLRPSDALRVARVGDLSLNDKTWPTIGHLQNWKREEWAMPPFVRRDDITKKAWRVQYSDADANRVFSEEAIAYAQASEFERDAVLGAGVVEIVLTKLLQAGRNKQ
jgi:hypothetical protein